MSELSWPQQHPTSEDFQATAGLGAVIINDFKADQQSGSSALGMNGLIQKDLVKLHVLLPRDPGCPAEESRRTARMSADVLVLKNSDLGNICRSSLEHHTQPHDIVIPTIALYRTRWLPVCP